MRLLITSIIETILTPFRRRHSEKVRKELLRKFQFLNLSPEIPSGEFTFYPKPITLSQHRGNKEAVSNVLVTFIWLAVHQNAKEIIFKASRPEHGIFYRIEGKENEMLPAPNEFILQTISLLKKMYGATGYCEHYSSTDKIAFQFEEKIVNMNIKVNRSKEGEELVLGFIYQN